MGRKKGRAAGIGQEHELQLSGDIGKDAICLSLSLPIRQVGMI